MCSQYTIKASILELLGTNAEAPLAVESIDARILPSREAPVLVKDHSKLKLTPMRFSLIPSWSKEPKVKFATHNAQIESVTEKPTWKIPFQSQHCVIPMTGFFESVYDGPEAGHIIQFAKPDHRVLWAAGIFDFWKNKDEPEKSIFSFSILTQEPSEFILYHGHDRTPIFINDTYKNTWLDLVKKEDEFIRDELMANSYHPELEVTIDRPLKAGWEKRK